MKILIIGFQHSGTTLLRLLIQAHPQVSIIFHEYRYIELNKNKDWMMSLIKDTIYPGGKKMSWGDKIPWIDGNGDRIIYLCKKWIKFFKNDSRIIHIMRHPIDTSISISKSMESLPLILKSLPKVIKFINSTDLATTVLFEELVTYPNEILNNIFKFCNLESTPTIIDQVLSTNLKFNKVNKERAFSFRKQKIEETVDYFYLINSLKHKIRR